MADVLRALVVEDVALARAALLRLLGPHHDIEVTGTAASLAEAERLRSEQRFDVAFLDILLPDGNGIDFAQSWAQPVPQIVFITANPEFAVDAFAIEAQDYLLKPITPAGVERALTRIRRQRLSSAQTNAPEPIEVRDGGRTSWIDPSLVDYVDVAGHYLCLHVGQDVHLLRRSIADFAEELGHSFVRIHRSAIVRLDRVRAVTARRNGDADIELTNGAIIKMSRGYRDAFEQRMRTRET